MNVPDLHCLARQIANERVTVDRIVCNGPAYIYGLHITSNSSGEATATIYNGSSAKAVQKIDMSCVDDHHEHADYWPPMYFDRGVYVALGSNVASVLVRYCSHGE